MKKNRRRAQMHVNEGTEAELFCFDTAAKEPKLHVCPLTGERLYEIESPCGARLFYLHKDVRLSAGVASIPYGGAESHVMSEDGRRIRSLPGIAHFAEHMLFTGKGGRLERFIALGADANAYTSMESTAYCFTAGTEEGTLDGFSELIKMVTAPDFDEGQTEKEREIILRELGEDDDVFCEGRKRAVEMLFSRGSSRRDAGGDVKSVKSITNEMLRDIYGVAYVPSETVFTLVSGVGLCNARGVFEINLLGEKNRGRVKHSYCGNVKRKERSLACFKHRSGTVAFFCAISFDISDIIADGKKNPHARSYVYTSMLNAMLFDRSEPFFERLVCKAGGIFGEFVSDTEIRGKECLMTANLMCEDPVAVARAFEELLCEMRESEELFSFEHFESKRRILCADYLSVLESPTEAAIAISEYAQRGECFFDTVKIIQELDPEEFKAFAKKALADAATAYAAATEAARAEEFSENGL